MPQILYSIRVYFNSERERELVFRRAKQLQKSVSAYAHDLIIQEINYAGDSTFLPDARKPIEDYTAQTEEMLEKVEEEIILSEQQEYEEKQNEESYLLDILKQQEESDSNS